MLEQIFYKKYDFKTKIETIIENDKVIRETKWDDCPYVFFGDFAKDIESGKIRYVMFKKLRLARI
jgi:hypothetical protein